MKRHGANFTVASRSNKLRKSLLVVSKPLINTPFHFSKRRSCRVLQGKQSRPKTWIGFGKVVEGAVNNFVKDGVIHTANLRGFGIQDDLLRVTEVRACGEGVCRRRVEREVRVGQKPGIQKHESDLPKRARGLFRVGDTLKRVFCNCVSGSNTQFFQNALSFFCVLGALLLTQHPEQTVFDAFCFCLFEGDL